MVVGVDGQVGVAVAQGSGSYERPTILCENRRRDFPSQKKLQLARRSASYSTIFCTLVPTYLCLTTSNHPKKKSSPPSLESPAPIQFQTSRRVRNDDGQHVHPRIARQEQADRRR